MRHAVPSTWPNSFCGPTDMSAGRTAATLRQTTMARLSTTPAMMAVRAAVIPPTLWIMSRSVKVSG